MKDGTPCPTPAVNWGDVAKGLAKTIGAVAAVASDGLTEIPELIEGAEALTEGGGAAADGSFSISDWSGYPEGVPKPNGPFRLVEGDEYAGARSAANKANRLLRQGNPEGYAGRQIHEIQPIKFGGSPTDAANKIPLTQAVHAQATNWWNSLMRSIGGE